MNINVFKHTSCLRGESPLIHGSNRKSLKVTSSKGSVQSDEYKTRVRRSKSRTNPVKLSYSAWDSKQKVQRIHVNCTSDTDVTTEGSLAIHGMFKRWLTVLPLVPRNQDETFFLIHRILKWIRCNFLGMDATIKIPAIIFIPLFLTVNVKYRAHVTKELLPLWICGPLLIALYIKTLQVLCSLYVFSFEQSVKLLTTLHGKVIAVHFWQHVVNFMNLDHKHELKRIWKDFQVWLVDTGLDFVGSVWSYRKMIVVLKMAKIM
ncbi:hypothetical protein HanRHA438_Chr02g0052771 [Helianthus annuus]|uniref:Uncharacterized protein n=1 Tax=Helianthus annuus TaxID=4232 RepID=A0A251VE45_HELAN|nr:uncharacterized protein LOC110912332 isoform X1 [Helianthus annuus]XP_022012727.1 uncharacterized protein LOC110912332 isoform X1 [Helianthus annuus]XP_022012734.1 uncharacterized protein LOC110912332 isoform X1 [Helianthus annuus]XP_035835596.1 uncharacterized protein LOC110912332 isoform X1 [Helianthus annuus]KAF5817305.1 hypothetical protein HanXRQr2_Chr02g0051491 [Helianthus annuus]KAJ0603768.1 hypothetical protein HanHA300_Chr02g0042041 [Helianthus annuus]KAJ0614000.1 hypothetical pro